MAAIWAARVGEISPGRKATRNFSLLVCVLGAAVASQASSHPVPVGVSTAANPSCSAALATCPRYSMSGGRSPGMGRACAWAIGRLCPRP